MNIHIVLIAYALDITPLVDALAGDDVTWHVFRHSQREDVRSACESLVVRYGQERIVYHPYGTNRGLSTSWNDGILEAQEVGADVIVVINDDVTANRDDLLKLAQGAVDHPECGVIVAEGFNERMDEQQILGYAVFAINPIALEKVGMFDQNAVPYCFEDSDHSRRCALAGVTFHNVGATSMVHRGSATVGSVPALNTQNQRTFAATAEYYKRKWNGLPGSESYSVPFNDPQFGPKIEMSVRAQPYPGYNRTDLEELIKV